MAGFIKKLFGKKEPEEKLDLETVRKRKTLTPEEQDLYRQEAAAARVPPLPSRGRSYKRRSIKGRKKARQARGKAALALQARFRGNKSRQNTQRLRKHRDTMQPKLGEIEYDNDEDEDDEDDEDDEYDGRPATPPPPPSSRPSVAVLRRNFESNQGGKRTRKRRRKRRRKTKRKGRRKTKKKRKMRKRKTRRKR